MGLERILTKEQLKKIIVLPMLLAGSYQKSGDIVPQEYIDAEKNILGAVGSIITPSATERDYVVSKYNVEPSKITVIPRAVGREFVGNSRKLCHDKIELCYVASFKNQKNNIEAIKLVKKLQDLQVEARLHLAGTLQDASVYQQCQDYVTQNKLSENVIFHGIMSQAALADFYSNMDFNVSTSLCETFGRSIFEGLAMGLPTLAYDCLEEVIYLTNREKGIIFVKNYIDMAESIKYILKQQTYEMLSEEAINIGRRFSYKTQEQSILSTIEKILMN
jgi:glycosyltransferase involved in cell wall biosynthesis